MKKDLITIAADFARAAHESINQRRKYPPFEPYIVHPERVATILQAISAPESAIAAAWLHDVLEDVAHKRAEFSASVMRKVVGDEVTQLVIELTDISKPEDGNRAIRKAIDRAHSAKASPLAKTIKLADIIDNYLDISRHDPHFARVFKKEAKLLLPLLIQGDTRLWQQLAQLLGV